ncbi:aminotransferase class I/II-fold pyridoxal phosphate-dependent enzyme [Micromonospora sp. DT4]|uniref:aminotransferase class I/II-fold pyridoxal phosphate-dependent enzyme n=1 Tax=Micromonospora sp. DT4 TaxID=3393438 RepID=UPI003CED3B7B
MARSVHPYAPAGCAPATRCRPAARVHLRPEPSLPTGAGSALWKPWEPAPMHRPDGTYDFRRGTPALASFPVARWRKSLADAVSRADAVALGYGPAEGSPSLRTQIAALLRRSRALDARREDTVVTSGAFLSASPNTNSGGRSDLTDRR